jgi:pimeloyl-ACP methyl ester carboxylesterase
MDTLQVDGASLVYDDAGSGAPPLLLVHGWAGNRSNLGPQMAHFAGRHRVVAVDRRGHGQSDAPEQEYTVEGAADDLAVLCRELGLARAVVVQHSFDRLAYDFAARYPNLVLAIAVLDGPTLPGEAAEAAFREFLVGLESDHWQAAIRGYAEQAVFPPGMPRDAKEAALAELLRTPRHVLVSSWRHFVEYPTEETLARVRCPFLFVAGAFPADLNRLRGICPQVSVEEVRNAGHFIQLTAPDVVNGLLEDFVAQVSGAAASVS